MGVAAADEDGDGRADLFVTNARRQVHAAFRSKPPDDAQPSFDDVRAALGPSYGLDRLGRLLGRPRPRRRPGLRDRQRRHPGDRARRRPAAAASPCRTAGAIRRSSSPGPRRCSPAEALVADYDDDGDLDLAVSSVGGALVLLENTGTTGRWLEVALDGPRPGAEVAVVLPDGRELRRQLLAGSSYLSSEDPRAHFGLGTTQRVREVVVRWPDGRETRVDDVETNRRLELEPPE